MIETIRTSVDNFVLLFKAALAGFIVAVPIGAIGAMCLRRALQGRWIIAITTGFGAAAADALLATAAMLGLTLLTHYLLENQKPVLLVGGAFLIVIGVRMLLKRRPKITTCDLLLDDSIKLQDAVVRTKVKNLHLIAGNPTLNIAQIHLMSDAGMQFKLKRKIDDTDYDFIFIDTPPSLGN